MERLIAIIRINSQALSDELDDLRRFNLWGYNNINYRIPKVTVLKRVINKGHEFVEKPLLFNYGFLEMPLEFIKNPVVLQELRVISRLIQGFFRKTEEDLKAELEYAEKDGLPNFKPVLVKTITRAELERLIQISREINVYDDVKQLDIGTYIVLKGYPFEGLGAEVLRKKTNGKLQVRLIESGVLVELKPDNIYYSAYGDLA